MRHYLFIFIIFVALVGFIPEAQATSTVGTSCPSGSSNCTIVLPNPFGTDKLSDVVDRVVKFLRTIAIPVVTIMVLVGGFQIMTAGGDPAKFTKGRSTLLYAAVGLVVILVATSVSLFIENVLKK